MRSHWMVLLSFFSFSFFQACWEQNSLSERPEQQRQQHVKMNSKTKTANPKIFSWAENAVNEPTQKSSSWTCCFSGKSVGSEWQQHRDTSILHHGQSAGWNHISHCSHKKQQRSARLLCTMHANAPGKGKREKGSKFVAGREDGAENSLWQREPAVHVHRGTQGEIKKTMAGRSAQTQSRSNTTAGEFKQAAERNLKAAGRGWVQIEQVVCVSCEINKMLYQSAAEKLLSSGLHASVASGVCCACWQVMFFFHFRLIFLLLVDDHWANRWLQRSCQSSELRNEWKPDADTHLYLTSTMRDVWATQPLFQKSGDVNYWSFITFV